MIPYGRQNISDNDVAAVTEVLASDWLTTGPSVDAFEVALSNTIGGTPVFSVSSGTAALHAAYAAAGISYGDEIITTPLTFVATQATAVLLGATPVFADVREDTGTIDPQLIESLIGPRTKAIVTVDYAGNPCDLDLLRKLSDQYGLLLIEDAAHSLGSTFDGRPVGSIADITTFSFFPTKNITTGEGGAVACLNSEVFTKGRTFARQGLIRDSALFSMTDEGPWHQEVHEFGLNYRLPDILAALGTSQLSRLQEFKERRREIKARYDQHFVKVEGLTTPAADSGSDPLWHLYPLRVPVTLRRRMVETLRAQGIGVQVNYLPSYWHPAFDEQRYPKGLCPVAEQYYRQEISLPIHTRLSDDQVDLIAEAVIKCVS